MNISCHEKHKVPNSQNNAVWHIGLVTMRYGVEWRAWLTNYDGLKAVERFSALDYDDTRNFVAKRIK